MNAPTRLRPRLKVMLASPRGFCAGVDRAVQMVERAIDRFGAPVYVRHEIVHNRHVVERLARLGAVFVDELDQAPDDRPVIFSAHGVPRAVAAEARRRNLFYLDATCPLVSKVHAEIRRHHGLGRQIVLIGHAGHPEVLGAMGQAPEGAVVLVETREDVARLRPRDPEALAFVTQTTLSVDDAAEIISALKARFPRIVAPGKTDICYATSNRQDAFKKIASHCDLVLVVGSRTSSNSMRLVEVALKAGAGEARLVEDAEGLDFSWFDGVDRVGLTAGASAPEVLVEGVVDALASRFEVTVEEEARVDEDIAFRLPRVLAD
jgi:4-hydroxy-3-methylbut-2-enyl diphosphate reductase